MTKISENEIWKNLSEKERDGIKQWVIENFNATYPFDFNENKMSEHPAIELDGADLEDARMHDNILICQICGTRLSHFWEDPISHIIEEHYETIPEPYRKGRITQKFKRPYQLYVLEKCPLCNGSHNYEMIVNYNLDRFNEVIFGEIPVLVEVRGTMKCPVKNGFFNHIAQLGALPYAGAWGFTSKPFERKRSEEELFSQDDFRKMTPEEAVKMYPNDSAANYDYAFLLEQQGEYTEAEIYYNNVIRLVPTDAACYFALGNLYKKQKQFDQAKKNYQKAISYRPDFIPALVNLGNMLRDQGSLQEAKIFFERALASNPNEVPANVNFALLLLDLNELEYAERLLTLALQLDPLYPLGHTAMGDLRYKQKRPQEAEKYYLQFLIRAPHDVYSLYNLGLTYIELNRLEKAIEKFKQVLVLDPNHDGASFQLGFIKYVSNDLEGAQEDIIRALQLNPDNYTANLIRGEYLMKNNQLTEAEHFYQRALIIDDSNPLSYSSYARFLVKSEKYTHAKELLQKALALDETSINVDMEYGQLLEKEGNWEEAKKVFLTTLEKYPNAYSAHLLYASILGKKGLFAEAKERVEYVIVQDPDHQEAKEQLNLINRTFQIIQSQKNGS